MINIALVSLACPRRRRRIEWLASHHPSPINYDISKEVKVPMSWGREEREVSRHCHRAVAVMVMVDKYLGLLAFW